MAGPDEATIVHYVRWDQRHEYIMEDWIMSLPPLLPPHPDHPDLFPAEINVTGAGSPAPVDSWDGHHQPLHAKIDVVYRRPDRGPSP
jgi:hypothetical protein